MLELLLKGGFVMLPILICGLVAIAIFIERALYFFFISGTRYVVFRAHLCPVRTFDLQYSRSSYAGSFRPAPKISLRADNADIIFKSRLYQ